MKKTVYLGGGCFWGMQGYFDQIKGVLSTEVGYINGETDDPTYEEVCNGSGHAEVVKVNFEGDILSNQNIFDLFIRVIDPFSLNKQGEDKGVQYRTGIYSGTEDFMSLAAILEKWETENGKSAIEVDPPFNYTKAEINHQDYLKKNPTGYCHINLHDIPEEFKK